MNLYREDKHSMNKISLILSLILIVSVLGLTGCERVQDVVIDSMPEDTDDSMDAPVKLVLFVDYPEDGKDDYIAWVASVAATLQAPDEVTRIRSYDNEDPTMSPNRLVEFEFDNFLDAASYLNRTDISDILADIPNHTSKATVYTFIKRSDYDKSGEDNYPIKYILLINYPLGGKQAYLDWVASNSSTLTNPSELKAIASYDNFYGESWHRLVQFEFASREESEIYEAREDLQVLKEQLDTRTAGWTEHTFELRSDYINE